MDKRYFYLLSVLIPADFNMLWRVLGFMSCPLWRGTGKYSPVIGL